jgi:hypothetical protein
MRANGVELQALSQCGRHATGANGRGTVAMRFATQLDNISQYQNGLEQIRVAQKANEINT